MRRTLLVPLTMLAAACGGGTSTDPDGSAGPPASIAVSAGDNQSAIPGAAVGTAPTVIVRDASGRAVANVSVAFRVDSGGGTVATATTITNGSGVASAGSWTLGNAEGPQVLVATATGLAPIKIRALARLEPVTVINSTITAAGGTFTISQPGSLLNGAIVRVPAGTVDGSASLALAIGSSNSISLREGITPVGPALVLRTSATRFKHPIVVRFPTMVVPSGRIAMIAVYHPSTSAINFLTPAGASSNVVSGLLPGLDPSVSNTGASSSTLTAALRSEDEALLFMAAIDPAILAKSYDSQFRVQQDNWDFENFAIAWLPFLAGSSQASPADEVLDPTFGMVATSLWYFVNHRNERPLYGRFRLQPDQMKSNKAGIRWAALSYRDVEARFKGAFPDFTDVVDPVAFEIAQFNAIKLMFYQTFDRPVPVLLYETKVGAAAGGSTNGPYATSIGIATRTVGGDAIEIVVPDNMEAPYRIRVNAQGLVPFTVINRSGDTYVVQSIAALDLRAVIDDPRLAANWPRVVNGTVGDAEGWPKPELHYDKGKLDATKPIFLADQLVHWWECSACTDFGVAAPAFPPEASHPQLVQLGRITGGAMAPLPENRALSATRWTKDSVASDVAPTITGQVVYLPQPEVAAGIPAGWLDWQQVSYSKVSLHPSPSTLVIGRDTTVNFALAPSQPLPAGATYSWVLITSDGRDSVATTVPTLTKNLRAATAATLLIQVHEATTKRIIANDQVAIGIEAAAPFWRITSFVDADGLFRLLDEGGSYLDGLLTVLNRPGAGLLAVTESNGMTEFSLRIKSSGTWEECCPPSFGTAEKITLGLSPTVNHAFGPFFSAYAASSFTQGSDLNSGAMTSQYARGTQTWPIKEGGTQNGPNYFVKVTATRNGKILSGTITFVNFGIDSDDNELDASEIGNFRFQFTAERFATPAPRP